MGIDREKETQLQYCTGDEVSINLNQVQLWQVGSGFCRTYSRAFGPVFAMAIFLGMANVAKKD